MDCASKNTYDIIHHMKRTTIFIDEALENDLRALAEREKRSVSGLVREALASYVAKRKRTAPGPKFIALGRSGHRDTAEKHEELLWRDVPEESERSKSERRSKSAGSTAPSGRKRG